MMPAKTLNTLNLAACKDIAVSYQKVLTPSYSEMSWFYRNVSWFNSDMSSSRNYLSGTFYCGKHSRLFLTDYLAGGASNNFYFNCSPHNYGNFIYFVDALCKYKSSTPEDGIDVNSVLNQIIAAAENDDKIKLWSIVNEYRRVLPIKCYFDLKADFEADIVHYNTGDRKAETQSHRISKPMSIGYGICQGFIEMMGMTSLVGCASLALGVAIPIMVIIPLMALVFLAAFKVNYAISRENTKKTINKILAGHFFERSIGTIQDEKYERFTTTEIAIICGFSILSLIAGCSIFGLGVSALATSPLWIAYGLATAPLWIVYGLPLFLIGSASITFSNSVYEFIEKKGWEQLKNYFSDHFRLKNWYDVLGFARILFWEIPKLLISISISGIVCYVTFLTLQAKSIPIFGLVISTIAAGITAGVKSIFCVSKTSKLIDSGSESLTHCHFGRKPDSLSSEEEIKNTKQLFNVLQASNDTCEKITATRDATFLVVHSVSEVGVTVGTTGKWIEGIVKGMYAFFTSVDANFTFQQESNGSEIEGSPVLNSPKR